MTDKIIEEATSKVTQDDLLRMINFGLSEDQIVADAITIKYSGFDPRVTFNICSGIIGKNQSLMDLLQLLICFGLTRGFGAGKSMKNILDRTSELGKQRLKEAFVTFRVQFGEISDRNNTVITISRIMAAFPFFTFKNFNLLRKKGVIIDDVEFKGELPLELRYLGSNAMMGSQYYVDNKSSYLDFVQHVHENVWEYDDFDRDEAGRYADLSSCSKLVLPRHLINDDDDVETILSSLSAQKQPSSSDSASSTSSEQKSPIPKPRRGNR